MQASTTTNPASETATKSAPLGISSSASTRAREQQEQQEQQHHVAASRHSHPPLARRLNSNTDIDQQIASPFKHKNSLAIERQHNVAGDGDGGLSYLKRSTAGFHAGMTLDKLRFSSLGLYGRDDEISILSRCVERVLDASAGTQDVVAVSNGGESSSPSSDKHSGGQTSNNSQATSSSSREQLVTVYRRSNAVSGRKLTSCLSDRNLGGGGGGAHGKVRNGRQMSFRRDLSRRDLARTDANYGSIVSHSSVPTVCTTSTNPNPDHLRQLVLIRGYSGTGKTSLAATIENKCWKVGGIYARGKYDSNLRDEPYTGIAAACNDCCAHIIERIWDPTSKTCKIQQSRTSTKNVVSTRIVKDLIEHLGEEIPLLTQVIPKLDELVQKHRSNKRMKNEDDGGMDHDDDLPSLEHMQSYEGAQNRFNFAFRRFIRILSSYFKPLVFVLDDLQWSDLETLSLLQVLMTDQYNPNFIVIGCYRSNDLSQSQILPTLIRDLRVQAQDGKLFDMIEIEIGNLAVHHVNNIIMDLTSIDDESQTLGLAKICHDKTLGNVFFAIYFLSMLNEHRLLTYNFGLMKWTWDEQTIYESTKSTTNVVDIMKSRMEYSLPGRGDDYKRLLEIAACLGATFKSHVLCTVWNDFLSNDPIARYQNQGNSDGTSHSIDEMLSFFVKEGYINPVSSISTSTSANTPSFSPRLSSGSSSTVSGGGTTYRWVHDRIQEACFSLLPEEDVNTFKYFVGSSLFRNLRPNDVNNEIFVVVNLLNSGSSTDAGKIDARQHPTRLAKLNLRAARKAVALSAFQSAAKYAVTGIDVLPSDKWQTHYSLTLDLYSTAAEIECHLGRTDDMQRHCDEILILNTPSWSHKLRAYNVQVDSMYNRVDHQDAIELCLECLNRLGCILPKTEISTLSQTAKGINKAKKLSRKKLSDTIDTIRPMLDRHKIDAMELLDKLVRFCYFSHNNNLLPVVIFKMLKWTMEYGLCVSSPPAFAATALIFAGRIFEFDQAEIYAEMSLKVLEKLREQSTHNAKMVESRTKFVLYSFVYHWFKPYHEMSKPLLEGL